MIIITMILITEENQFNIFDSISTTFHHHICKWSAFSHYTINTIGSIQNMNQNIVINNDNLFVSLFSSSIIMNSTQIYYFHTKYIYTYTNDVM